MIKVTNYANKSMIVSFLDNITKPDHVVDLFLNNLIKSTIEYIDF